MKQYVAAVVGATGLVGSTIVEVLASRRFPVRKLIALASPRSAGKEVAFGDQQVRVEALSEQALEGVDLVFFAAGGAVSKQWAPTAKELGALMVDNSSMFRMDPQVPLVVPEVNPQNLQGAPLIANPNCSTIQCVVPLHALKPFRIKRVVYSTYQAVSGSGQKGLDDLDNGTQAFYPRPIGGNVLPHIDSFTEDGYTKEEHKMIDETRRILDMPDLRITATTVRVPVRFGHAASVNVAFDRPFDLQEVRAALSQQPGLVLMDDPQQGIYPTPQDAAGRDDVLVGRVRRDFSVESGLNMWVVADNIRKGAAVNAVQIAEAALGLKA